MTRQEFIKRRIEEKGMPYMASSAIRGLEAYKNAFYFEPALNWDRTHFENRCTAIWVVDSIEKRIKESPEDDPIRLAEDFMLDLIFQMNNTDNRQREEMFRVASHIAEEIVDYMHCMF